MKIIRNIFIVVLLFGIGFFLFRVDIEKGHFIPGASHADSIFIFPNLKGPMDSTVIPPTHRSSWKKYADGEDFGVAVLLLDTSENSNWMGLAHAFKTFGIPFKFYFKSDIDQALKNDVVFAYPSIDASQNGGILAKLSNYPRKGGTLIGQCVESGLNDVFGFRTSTGTSQNYKIKIAATDNPVLQEFTDPHEREIILANSKLYRESEGTYDYGGLSGPPLMVYPNGMAFLTEKDYPGGGKAYCFGIDLGYFAATCYNDRTLEARRTYVNGYEPSMDVLFRVVKNIYSSSSKTAVTLGTVQENKKMTLCLTHDIDYLRSMYGDSKYNALGFAKLEQSKKVQSTFFVQVKYIQDWNDVDFFNDSAVGILHSLDSMKMEIASHSISHSQLFDKFPLGTGAEKYPTYRPIVRAKYITSNGTILGELRVSKFLLDHFVTDHQVVSFRPGHLRLPYTLPQCLAATGYKYSSDVTANEVLTHLPYQLSYGLDYSQELPVFEFPLTIEDEELPQMDKRLDSAEYVAREISKYGGLMCVLIHPNELGYKYTFEQGLLDNVQSTAHVTTLRDFGDWWTARNEVRYYVVKNGTGYELHINTPAPISDLTFFVPATWACSAPGQTAMQTGNTVLVKNVTNGMTINFTAQ